jgi:hypothetical protein
MNPRLRVEVGRQINFEYEIPADEEGPVWLGRGAFCAIRIADDKLSKRHCQFTVEDGQFLVEDLGSTNGTRVNEDWIQEKVQLKDGDRVTVGNHELRVIYPPESQGADIGLPELGSQEEDQAALEELRGWIGTPFAGYVLEKDIFNGDASVVFRGRDPETGRTVAVKVLKRLQKVTVEDQNRFIRGAKHSAKLRHPNFVRVYRGGRFEDWFFVAMEYVAGRNLQDIVERQGAPLEVPIALKIASQVLDALQYAYEQGIVFRAVRPDNVIVCQGMTCKLTDFDLVKPLAGRHEAQVTRVMDGSLSVDPSFAAPELIAYPVVADQKADVFGAGAVLYYALCAKAPFGGALPKDKLTSAFDRAAQDPRDSNPDVPDSICEILQQAMSDYERYSTPGEMKEALEQAAQEAGL